MKNIRYIIVLLTFFLNFESYGQLPLKYGDAVVTHSPNGNAFNGIVVRTIQAGNTSTAPLGSNWNTATMIPSGTKTPNFSYSNWTSTILGPVYGITLDQNPSPNIYVSSSQIYVGGANQNRKIWRLDGTTGSNSLVYDFNNPSGSGNLTSAKSLGNLKYSKFGMVENIYVSDFNTGEIHRLTGNSSSTSLWATSSTFSPKFGGSSINPIWVPYGLAVRKVLGSSKLYYAKLNMSAMVSTFEIWSVDLNTVGDFILGTETIQVLPAVVGNPKTPIADIAFTENGKKMLIGQQTWQNFLGGISAHQSMIIELANVPFNSNNWVSSGNNFPSGTYGSGTNCVGGVSYSNNILLTNNQYACDTSVYFTSDAIHYPSPFVYGVEAYPSSGGVAINSIWIDQDDDITTGADKTYLGDIEIYKNPNACTPPCTCGQWENINSSGTYTWNPNTLPIPPTYPSTTQGNATGILFPHYICNGNCNATYNFNITNNASGTITNLNGTTSLDLSQPAIRNLPCGSYIINITPNCGNASCPPIGIPFVIVCPPECSDCGGNASVTQNGAINYVNGNITGNFTINNSKPVAEVRVLVDEFRITSANDNCLLCKNPPKTWGSIQTATLGSLAPAFNNALTIDNREVVFNNHGVLSMPANISIALALPASVGLSCCEVQVQACLKFIIRDVNCCEKEVLKCFNFTIPQTQTR